MAGRGVTCVERRFTNRARKVFQIGACDTEPLKNMSGFFVVTRCFMKIVKSSEQFLTSLFAFAKIRVTLQ